MSGSVKGKIPISIHNLPGGGGAELIVDMVNDSTPLFTLYERKYLRFKIEEYLKMSTRQKNVGGTNIF